MKYVKKAIPVIEILERQARCMGNYLKCLEIRAEIEKIKLEV